MFEDAYLRESGNWLPFYFLIFAVCAWIESKNHSKQKAATFAAAQVIVIKGGALSRYLDTEIWYGKSQLLVPENFTSGPAGSFFLDLFFLNFTLIIFIVFHKTDHCNDSANEAPSAPDLKI